MNLIYAAYHQRSSPETFLAGLLEELSLERVEIDVLELKGPAFAGVDSRLWCLHMLRNGMSHAFVFDSKAQAVEPATSLRKRPVIVHSTLHSDATKSAAVPFQAAREQFLAEGKALDHEPVAIIALTKRNFEDSASDNAALLARIEQLAPLGTVVVTDYIEGYELMNYFRRYTPAPIRVIFWISDLLQTMEETVYHALPGAVLERLGRLLFTDVTIYVAPMSMQPLVAAYGGVLEGVVQQRAGSDLITLDDVLPKSPTEHLFRYLRAAGRIVPLKATQTAAR